MYSFASCGTGVGVGWTRGFQLLRAFFGRGLPNQPTLSPVSGSVDGNQPFFAKIPNVNITVTKTAPIVVYVRVLRPSRAAWLMGKSILFVNRNRAPAGSVTRILELYKDARRLDSVG